MQIFKSVWRILMALPILTSSFVLADDHMLNGMNVQQPFNLQANLCKLNPGVSLEDYHAMV
ncbi:MAG: hypothetical protein HOI91_06445, partial [Halieaceae bacterium]|nr:hypothetical protein [Halieaceae bacterium]